jgi:hypothetical protein
VAVSGFLIWSLLPSRWTQDASPAPTPTTLAPQPLPGPSPVPDPSPSADVGPHVLLDPVPAGLELSGVARNTNPVIHSWSNDPEPWRRPLFLLDEASNLVIGVALVGSHPYGWPELSEPVALNGVGGWISHDEPNGWWPTWLDPGRVGVALDDASSSRWTVGFDSPRGLIEVSALGVEREQVLQAAIAASGLGIDEAQYPTELAMTLGRPWQVARLPATEPVETVRYNDADLTEMVEVTLYESAAWPETMRRFAGLPFGDGSATRWAVLAPIGGGLEAVMRVTGIPQSQGPRLKASLRLVGVDAWPSRSVIAADAAVNPLAPKLIDSAATTLTTNGVRVGVVVTVDQRVCAVAASFTGTSVGECAPLPPIGPPVPHPLVAWKDQDSVWLVGIAPRASRTVALDIGTGIVRMPTRAAPADAGLALSTWVWQRTGPERTLVSAAVS